MSTTAESANLVRPLRTIEEDIRQYIDAGDHAAREASQPFYRRAGPLLVEAKEGHFAGNSAGFYDWAQKKFGKTKATIGTWVAMGNPSPLKPFKTQEDFLTTPKEHGGLGLKPKATVIRREWGSAVSDAADHARREAVRLAQEDALSRWQERDAERKLAIRLIDIGYKVLAKELHPDKMDGDKRAFQRLVRVRDKLKTGGMV